MRDEIQYPVADHESREHEEHRHTSRGRHERVAEHEAPNDERNERVRIRIADEFEPGERRVVRMNPNLLDASSHENRPQEIGELCGAEQDGERHLRRHALRGEPDAEMPDEHLHTLTVRRLRALHSFA